MPFNFSTDLNVLIAISLLCWSSWGLFDKKLVLLMCLLATLLWGVTGLFDKKALGLDLPFKIYYARCIWDAVILAVMLLVFRLINYKVAYKSVKAWKYSGFSSICLSLGTLSYMFAMTMATASYVIVITSHVFQRETKTLKVLRDAIVQLSKDWQKSLEN